MNEDIVPDSHFISTYRILYISIPIRRDPYRSHTSHRPWHVQCAPDLHTIWSNSFRLGRMFSLMEHIQCHTLEQRDVSTCDHKSHAESKRTD
jgi:hypothetical protein